jgi:predicted amidohydrolase
MAWVLIGAYSFQVWDTKYAKIGVGICWDQWFPETARCLALMGAEILFYPTAIGSEPQDASIDSQPHWTRVMQVLFRPVEHAAFLCGLGPFAIKSHSIKW